MAFFQKKKTAHTDMYINISIYTLKRIDITVNKHRIYSCVQLNDLPDEILMIIFKKWSNIALIYSFIDINKRLNKKVYTSIFTYYYQ